MKPMFILSLGVLVVAGTAGVAGAQQPARLPEVEVTVTREAARSPLELPYAITSVHPDSLRPGQRHLSFDELLFALPGLAVANRANPTQDPRISIRGFGARSAFGVRGVRILRDGIPLTLPDGQTPIDYLDVESVGRIDVIRGSAAALYGNAAGGVVDVRTAEAPADVLAGRVSGAGGAYGMTRWSGAAGGRSGALRYQGDLSRTEQDGFRRYARQETTSGSARLVLARPSGDVALGVTAYDMPESQNPGALTRSQMGDDPRQADPLQVRRGARKAVQQWQSGLSATQRWGEAEATAIVYGGTRSLDNPLTFAIVDVNRESYGASVRGTVPARLFGATHRLSAGADWQLQDDDRLNFANCNDVPPIGAPTADCPVVGRERGVVRLEQRERVSSVGPYLRDEIRLGERVLATAAVRADFVRFEVTDRLIAGTDPDDSGERTLRAVSPMVGLVARVAPLHAVHATVSTAFETPTATELANQPDGSAGINRELKPQYATTYEVGVKGIALSRLRYDIALFATSVRDELIPFEIVNGGGRRYFRNAGRTDRRGGEIGLGASAGPLDLGAAYSYSDFTFERYVVDGVDHSGNRIPGIPIQQMQAHLTWSHRGSFATVEGVAAGGVFVDDANAGRSAGSEVMNVRAGTRLALGRGGIAPYVGVQNLFDRRYAGSVVVNAAQGKYFEPAPGRSIYAGLALSFGR